VSARTTKNKTSIAAGSFLLSIGAPTGIQAHTILLPKAIQCLLDLLYAGQSLQRKTFEKRDRNAEIYRRYLAGEDSVVLGRAFGLGARRIRDIIEHARKCRGQ